MSIRIDGCADYRDRRTDRYPAAVSACLEAGGVRQAFDVLDISTDGVMGLTHGAVRIGGRVLVDLPALGAVPGSVRWALVSSVGIRFFEPLTPAQVALVLVPVVADAA